MTPKTSSGRWLAGITISVVAEEPKDEKHGHGTGMGGMGDMDY